MNSGRNGNTEGRPPQDVLLGRPGFDTGVDKAREGCTTRQLEQAAPTAHPQCRRAEGAAVMRGAAHDAPYMRHATPCAAVADGHLPSPYDTHMPAPDSGAGQRRCNL